MAEADFVVYHLLAALQAVVAEAEGDEDLANIAWVPKKSCADNNVRRGTAGIDASLCSARRGQPFQLSGKRRTNTLKRGLQQLANGLELSDINLLIDLATGEMNREGENKEREVLRDSCYFYRLLDMRNKLMLMRLGGSEAEITEEPPVRKADHLPQVRL